MSVLKIISVPKCSGNLAFRLQFCRGGSGRSVSIDTNGIRQLGVLLVLICGWVR